MRNDDIIWGWSLHYRRRCLGSITGTSRSSPALMSSIFMYSLWYQQMPFKTTVTLMTTDHNRLHWSSSFCYWNYWDKSFLFTFNRRQSWISILFFISTFRQLSNVTLRFFKACLKYKHTSPKHDTATLGMHEVQNIIHSVLLSFRWKK